MKNNRTSKESKHDAGRPIWPVRVWCFYRDGFREMTTGRYLWALILVKIAIIFLVFRLVCFRDVLARGYGNDSDRAQAVRSSMLDPDRH